MTKATPQELEALAAEILGDAAMTAPSIREALKPCPFCGSDRVSSAHQRDGRVIGCAGCGARVGAFQPGAEEKATEKWNTRTTPAPPADAGMREALEAALNFIQANMS